MLTEKEHLTPNKSCIRFAYKGCNIFIGVCFAQWKLYSELLLSHRHCQHLQMGRPNITEFNLDLKEQRRFLRGRRNHWGINS